MQSLQLEVVQRLRNSLNRKAVTLPSKWATKYRFMGPPYPGPYSFDRHPWAKEMHDSQFESNVGQKSAQMGFTEVGLNKAFYAIDIEKISVLYVLPNTKPDASDFSSTRFDVALELSEHLQSMFSNVQNVGLKRAGAASLYIRGSNSRPQLKSIPAGLIVFDELEEMDQDNVPLAMERMSGQIKRQDWKISTPQIPNYGINFYFNKSTQDEFYFKCPSCDQYINLHFDPEGKEQNNLMITGENENDPNLINSYLFCHKCKNKLKHEDKIIFEKDGIWKATYEGRDTRGFYISQLNGMNQPQSPPVIAKKYLASLHNVGAEQEFWNSNIGKAKVPKDAQITDEHIQQCITNQRQVDFRPNDNIITMGIDVGKVIHIVVNDWEITKRIGNDVNTYAYCRNLMHKTVYKFEELDQVMLAFKPNFCVIDSQPERSEARKFANRFFGRVRICSYLSGVSGRQMTQGSDEELSVNVDRTSWLDMSLGRFRNKMIKLPLDTKEEYKTNIKAQVRLLTKDRNGNLQSKYVTPGEIPDHYAHAHTYAEIALPLAVGIGINKDYKDG